MEKIIWQKMEIIAIIVFLLGLPFLAAKAITRGPKEEAEGIIIEKIKEEDILFLTTYSRYELVIEIPKYDKREVVRVSRKEYLTAKEGEKIIVKVKMKETEDGEEIFGIEIK